MPKSYIQIRKINIKNINQITPLFDAYRQFYNQKSDLKLAKKFISERFKNQQSIIFIALLEKKAVGFIQLYPSFSSVLAAKILVLNDLYVVAEARKLGVATALMNKAKDYAVKNKIKRLSLSTAKNNLTAKSLYESLGYVLDLDYDHYSLELNRRKSKIKFGVCPEKINLPDDFNNTSDEIINSFYNIKKFE